MPLPDTIETPRLLLRPPRVEDAAAIFHAWATDAQVTRYLVWRPHRSIDETVAFLETCAPRRAENKSYPWAITTRDDGTIIGMIDLRRTAPGEMDFGYVLARDAWGRGYATEALRAVLAAARALPDVQRIWATCDVDNRASARVMEKAGLVREGLEPRAILHPNISDEPRDVYRYALPTPAAGG